MARRVTAKLTGAAAGGVPSGGRDNMLKAMGMMVTATSMMTVPATNGVITRLSSTRREPKTNWNRDETTIKVASRAGPPSTRAVIDTATKVPEVPIRRMYPAPMLPTRTAWMTVIRPQTQSPAKTAQER